VEFFRELRAREGLGSFNVVLSDGRHVWAHRAGRTLAVLRRPSDSPCGAAIMIASEELTDEPWTEVPDGTVVEIVGGTTPQISVLDGTFAF
jgi:predicted glutamine amidotransferase